MPIDVAPLTGAWIETRDFYLLTVTWMSPPSRGRGLKRAIRDSEDWHDGVAPLTGAWIETAVGAILCCVLAVAPLTAAWIETLINVAELMTDPSPPSRGRGLKQGH